MGFEAVEETSEAKQNTCQSIGERIKQYTVDWVKWLGLNTALNEYAEKGWELHTQNLNSETGEYTLIFVKEKPIKKKHIPRKGL